MAKGTWKLFWATVICCALANGARADHEHKLLLGAIYPRISADGQAIVFAWQGAIWRVDRQGGAMRRLSREPGYNAWPTWSPDGKQVAYVNGRHSPSGPLSLINAEDGTVVKLPHRPVAKHKIQFSNDGRKLFGLFHKNGRFGLRWFELQTGELSDSLLDDQRGLRYALSHDGKSVALATSQDRLGEQGGNNGPQCDIWLLPIAGGEKKKLVRFPGRVYDVAWHADGKSLYVVSNVGGAHNDLWRVPLSDSLRDARKLTFGQADEDAPTMDTAGRWLVYSDNRRGLTSLVVRDLRTSLDAPITLTKRNYGQPLGRLLLEVLDDDGKQRTTARVSVRDKAGQYYAPPRSLYRLLRGDLHFYCRGSISWELPAGEYQVKYARGPEYKVKREKIVVTAGRPVRHQLRLERWTNQRSGKWYSGESHIHANYGYGEWYNTPRTMLAQSAGEDLIVSNFVVANSEADGVFDREFFRGSLDPLSTANTLLYWNEEFRSTIWGHLTLLNLKQLVEPIFTGFAHTTNPHDHPTNADIADRVHDQHGHVNYTHPAQNIKDPYLSAYSAKALPLDVALGKVDSMDIMGSNHQANMAVWYRLLNCGFRVPASAGTDCFLNRVRSRLPGQVRVYVQVPGEFSYQRWVQGLKAGRTFVTDAPMFDFKVNDRLAGSTIKLNKPGSVRVRGRITSQYPLNRVEVIVNGKVGRSIVPASSSPLKVNVDVKLPLSGTSWIALRAAGPGHADSPTGGVFGHTSPVYVDIAGHPLDTRRDAAYFVEWIDRLRADIRKRNRIPARHQVHVESQIARAREVFNQLLQPTR